MQRIMISNIPIITRTYMQKLSRSIVVVWSIFWDFFSISVWMKCYDLFYLWNTWTISDVEMSMSLLSAIYYTKNWFTSFWTQIGQDIFITFPSIDQQFPLFSLCSFDFITSSSFEDKKCIMIKIIAIIKIQYVQKIEKYTSVTGSILECYFCNQFQSWQSIKIGD